MGFPRIISKNNKIYTKLGEFCLSCDGTNFFIVCHICQMEIQLQDHFWKHIQDEHNFLHGSLKEECQTTNYIEPETLMPLPLYRKVNDGEQQDGDQTDDSQDQSEPKDYTEMRSIEPNAVQVDIKVEPTNLNKTIKLQTATQTHNANTGTTQTIYQLPQAPTTYATIVHTPLLPTLTAAPPQTAVATTLMPPEMPKDSSTTASASSAISSEDGERWYICDHETCGLKFKYQSRLELHRSVHSKIRRFACELCGASFKQSCNLSTHRKKKHFLKGSKSLVSQSF
ncbi:AT-rich binding protein [Teleopsis dalmanni]|uniref:AT-rich binding protein n=1 Tax=Teleopsis dalmanni TaxID=139649 RepID=UPI0018CFBDA5|nr:AT-rich binding protein [Teleopsis dalmanni]